MWGIPPEQPNILHGKLQAINSILDYDRDQHYERSVRAYQNSMAWQTLEIWNERQEAIYAQLCLGGCYYRERT